MQCDARRMELAFLPFVNPDVVRRSSECLWKQILYLVGWICVQTAHDFGTTVMQFVTPLKYPERAQLLRSCGRQCLPPTMVGELYRDYESCRTSHKESSLGNAVI